MSLTAEKGTSAKKVVIVVVLNVARKLSSTDLITYCRSDTGGHISA